MSFMPKFVTFRSYAGYVERGTVAFDKPLDPASHIQVAAWLTAQMEAAAWGTVQSYDGAGMSGGILHNVAILPNQKPILQGDFWGLMEALPTLSLVQAKLAPLGWRVAGGKVRDAASGVLIDPEKLRTEISGPKGLSVKGPKAAGWCLFFSQILQRPDTRAGQVAFAIKWLTESRKDSELAAYRKFLSLPSLDSPVGLLRANISPEVDLAMCVYQSFTANGPTPAEKALIKATSASSPATFAKSLIRSLGTSNYGRWHDDPDDKNSRYDSTRRAVSRSGLWPASLVNELMPQNL